MKARGVPYTTPIYVLGGLPDNQDVAGGQPRAPKFEGLELDTGNGKRVSTGIWTRRSVIRVESGLKPRTWAGPPGLGLMLGL